MTHLIDKDALVAEIESKFQKYWKMGEDSDALQDGNAKYWGGVLSCINEVKTLIDTLEVKEVEEYKQPEYSCLKTVYWCGKKPHWNIGDMLAYYEFDSDIEGECILGKVINVELDEEQHDWLYTFEDGSVYDEQSLLEDQTYKKN